MNARAILAAVGLLTVIGGILPGTAASAANGSFPAESFAWTLPAVGGSTVSGWIEMNGTAPIVNATVTVNTAALAGIATLTTFGNSGPCPIAGSIQTCPEGTKDVGDMGAFWRAELFITIKPLAGAVNGTVVKVPVTTGGDGLTPQTGYLTMTFSSQPILATVFPDHSPVAAALGDHVTLAPIVTNAGASAAGTVVATFELTHGLAAESYDNCVYAPYPAGDGEFVRCTVPGPLAPGATEALTGFTALIQPDAPATAVARVVIDPSVAAPTDPFPGPSVQFTARPASGQTVTLTPSDGGANPPTYDPQRNPADESTQVNISGGTVDLAVAPIVLHAAVGATVTATVVVTNHGPNEISVNASGGNPVAGVEVRIPTWATATAVPADCKAADRDSGPDPGITHGAAPGYPYYYCASPELFLPVGSTVTFAFQLKITKTSADAGANGDGAAWLWRPAQQTDTSNDSGAITLIDAPPPSPSPSASPPPSSPASSPPSDATSTPPTGDTSGPGHLPKTGQDFSLIGLGGIVIVLVGLSLLLVSRLRRD